MRSKTLLLLAIVLTVAVFASIGFSQKQPGNNDAVAQITALEQESVKADLANDPSFAKKHYADDYTAGSSWGNWETKASILKDFADPQKNKTNSEEMSDLKVRTYGNTAIATFKETYDSLYHGQHRARTVLCTDTWLKQAGDWMVIANHCSQLAK